MFTLLGDYEKEYLLSCLFSLFRRRKYLTTKREQLRLKYSWAVPSAKAIDVISKIVSLFACTKVVDWGCGLGYWSHLLSKNLSQEVEIIAVDPCPFSAADSTMEPYFLSKTGNFDVLELHHGALLLLIWPPCWTTMAEQALHHFAGSVFVYIGEGPGGATAARGFFDLISSQWVCILKMPLRRWLDASDSLFVFCRKELVDEALRMQT